MWLQGNCTTAVPLQMEGPPLLPLLPGQCVLVADMGFAYVSYGRLWMHNLYLRHAASARADEVSLVVTTQWSGWLWLTLTTLQGAGKYADGGGATGLYARSSTYVSGAVLPFPAHMHAVGVHASVARTSMFRGHTIHCSQACCMVIDILLRSPYASALQAGIDFTGRAAEGHGTAGVSDKHAGHCPRVRMQAAASQALGGRSMSSM